MGWEYNLNLMGRFFETNKFRQFLKKMFKETVHGIKSNIFKGNVRVN